MPRGWFLVVVALISTLPAQETTQPAPATQTSPPSPAQESVTSAPIIPDSTRLEPIKTVQPIYPFAAEKDRLQGQVNVRFKVSRSGDVESTDLVSGIPALGQAAVDAMKDWKFKPFIRNGNPVEASSNILFDFVFCDTVPEPSNLLSSGAPNGATSKGIKVVRLSQNAAKQLILKKVEPVYPPLAKLGRVQGKVLIFAVIGKDGTMQYLKLIGGHPLLTQASLEAVKQWRYRPFTIDGEAIEAQTVITIDFTFN